MSSNALSVDMESLAATLTRICGEENLERDGTERYAIDGIQPAIAVAPPTAEAMGASLSAIARSNAAAIAIGGACHMSIGNRPSRYDVALSTRNLCRLVAYRPEDLTVTVEPGLPLVEMQRLLAEDGQYLPLNPPALCDPPERATIGGIVAANAWGSWRHAFGSARDLVLGSVVANVDGTLSRSGGHVVKNVAGYDMSKLHIGAHGTLGVIVELSFRVHALPAARAAFVASFDATAEVLALVQRCTRLHLHSVSLLDRASAASALEGSPPAWSVIAVAAGGSESVDRSMRELRALAPHGRVFTDSASIDDVERSLSNALLPPSPGAAVTRASVPPSRVLDAIDSLQQTALPGEAPRCIAEPSTGSVRALWPSVTADLLLSARERMRALGGSLVIEAAPSEIKAALDVWGASEGNVALARRLKSRFDPHDILAPGRFVGGRL